MEGGIWIYISSGLAGAGLGICNVARYIALLASNILAVHIKSWIEWRVGSSSWNPGVHKDMAENEDELLVGDFRLDDVKVI